MVGGCAIMCLGGGCQRLRRSGTGGSGSGMNNMPQKATEGPYRYDTYCGLYCGACDWMFANQEYEAALKAPGSQPSPPEFPCHGCKSDLVASFCASCQIRACARGKGVEFCFECQEYPCTKITAFSNDGHPHHAWGVKQQEVIQREGVAAWLEEQRIRWRCPSCGRAFGYYARKCKQCGQALRSCKDDLQT